MVDVMPNNDEHRYSIGDRVVRRVDDELGTVTLIDDENGAIRDVDMDCGRNRDVTHERFAPVIVPQEGMGATILMYTDTTPAIVTKVADKYILVAEVPHLESTRRRLNHEDEPYPKFAYDGDLQGEQGPSEKFRMVREGRYRKGDLGLWLNKSVRIVDYRQ